MIPAQIVSDLGTFTASVEAAAPVSQGSPLIKAALVNYGRSLVANIDSALTAAVGDLDASDPIGAAGDLVAELNYLAMSAYDQASLADMRGTVGRRVFNLAQS